MLDLGQCVVRHFTRVMPAEYVTAQPALSLHAAGIRRYVMNGLALVNPGPLLIIHTAGSRIRLEPKAGRSTMSATLTTESIRPASQRNRVEICFAGKWLQVPAVTQLTRQQLATCQREFAALRSNYALFTIQSRFRVHAALTRLLQLVMDAHEEQETHDPAAALKRLIDEDQDIAKNIATLSRTCGWSASYLRACFKNKYGVSPVAYRTSLRMSHAMDLLQKHALPIREVARRTGYRHVSHFSAAFKKHLKQSPSQARRDAAEHS